MKIAAYMLLLSMFSPSVFATSESEQALKVTPVTDGVWALVGPLNNRTPENLANNATFGVVVTKAGVVLIDSGGSYKGAQRIHEKIRRITDKPVKYVISSGGQDHRWFGNSYFKQQGATLIASKAARADHEARLQSQWNRVERMIGKANFAGTTEQYADVLFDSEYEFTLGSIRFVLSHKGQAHTPGDIFIWLPQKKVMFSGDIVYTERMLRIGEMSNSKSWMTAFSAMAKFKPEHIVPGHGAPTDLKQAENDTYRYLYTLRKSVAEFIEQGGDISEINKIDQSEFSYLKNYDSLKGRNAQKVYSEIEFE